MVCFFLSDILFQKLSVWCKGRVIGLGFFGLFFLVQNLSCISMIGDIVFLVVLCLWQSFCFMSWVGRRREFYFLVVFIWYLVLVIGSWREDEKCKVFFFLGKSFLIGSWKERGFVFIVVVVWRSVFILLSLFRCY